MPNFSDYLIDVKSQTDELRIAATEKSGVDCSGMSISAVADVVKNIDIGIVPTGTKQIKENGRHDVADVAFADVDVQPKLQEKTTTENGEFTPDEGFDGFGKFVVAVEGKEDLDAELTAQDDAITSLENAVDNLPADKGCTCGGIGTGDYWVKVIDYDGTILAEKRLNNGDTYTLPNAPSHDGLVFQEWSCSQEIVDGVITIANNNVMVGATYTTASGLSEFDITLTKATGLDVTLNMDGTKNWGDGTSDDLTTHTYTKYGNYTVTCNGTKITSSSSSGLFGQSSSVKNYYCIRARIGSGFTAILESVFQHCYSLKNVVIPQGVTTIYSGFANSCCSLTSVVIPRGVTRTYGNDFKDCYSLADVVIPQGFTNIGSNMFSGWYSLKNIVIPNSVTNISAYAFQNCFSLIKYNFAQHTKVPTLGSTNVFSGINKICKIYVPDALYDEWIVATNWSTYADYIYKASEMEA